MNDLSITEQAQALALVLAAGHKMGMPEPHTVDLNEHGGVQMRMRLDDLATWAEWADAQITADEPHEYMPGRWVVSRSAEGTIYDLPVRLGATEFGRMLEADFFNCDLCGAGFGSTAGFVADGTYDDWFEVELSRHMDGQCVESVVAS